MSGLTRRGVLKAGIAGLAALVLGQPVFAEEDRLRDVTNAIRRYFYERYEERLNDAPERIKDEGADFALRETLKRHGFESEIETIISENLSKRLTDFFKQHGYTFTQVPLLGYELKKEIGSERIKRKFFGEEHSFTLVSFEEPAIMDYDDYQMRKKTGRYANDSWTLSRDRVEFMPSVLEKEADMWNKSFQKEYELIKGKLEMPVGVNNPNFYAMLYTKANCTALGKLYEAGDFAKKLTQKFKEGIEIRQGMKAFDYFELPENAGEKKQSEKATNIETRAMLADIRHGDAFLAFGRCLAYRHIDDGRVESLAAKIILDGITAYASAHRDEFAIDYSEFDSTKDGKHLLKQAHKFTPEALQKAAQSVFETRYQGKTLARWLSH